MRATRRGMRHVGGVALPKGRGGRIVQSDLTVLAPMIQPNGNSSDKKVSSSKAPVGQLSALGTTRRTTVRKKSSKSREAKLTAISKKAEEADKVAREAAAERFPSSVSSSDQNQRQENSHLSSPPEAAAAATTAASNGFSFSAPSPEASQSAPVAGFSFGSGTTNKSKGSGGGDKIEPSPRNKESTNIEQLRKELDQIDTSLETPRRREDPYQPTLISDPSAVHTIHPHYLQYLQHICAMDAHKDQSQEELRLEHHAATSITTPSSTRSRPSFAHPVTVSVTPKTLSDTTSDQSPEKMQISPVKLAFPSSGNSISTLSQASFVFGAKSSSNPDVTSDNAAIVPAEYLSRRNKPKNAATRLNTTDFECLTKRHIRPLIELNDLINTLTSKEAKINSTRIVVAGDQSHGKTSLLEALSGVDLPRGEGIKTRVPLILQLREAGEDGKEYAKIRLMKENDEPEIIGLEDICEKVEEYTEKAAGPDKEIQDNPIELRVYRVDQDDLSVVDLPGITRNSRNKNMDGEAIEKLVNEMCEKYMKPEESIILNVVTAMVDFDVSKSLQLSKKHDKLGLRTMLCVTKIDQNKETQRLVKQINEASEDLGNDMIFAVRNRTQKENDEKLSLSEVRALERSELERLVQDVDDEPIKFGLGVDALSKQLVKIQYEQINKTLPKAMDAIHDQIDKLQRELDRLGKPLGNATACRAKVMQYVESSITELQNELQGRSLNLNEELGCQEGSCLTIRLDVNDWQTLRFKPFTANSDFLRTSSQSVGDVTFTLEFYPQYKRESDRDFGRPSAHYCLMVNLPDGVESIRTSSSVTLMEGGRHHLREATDIKTTPLQKNSIIMELLSPEKADKFEGPVTLEASIFVDNIFTKAGVDKGPSSLLCARLNTLQDDLVASVDRLYTNSYFFSATFRKKLAHEVSSSRGGIGLPGAIAPHVPVNILGVLRQKLPAAIKGYRDEVQEACKQNISFLVGKYFDATLHPKLHQLIFDKCKTIVRELASKLEANHSMIIEWESSSVLSSNHYFMDTVQSIRSSLAKDEKDRPPYLKDLSDSVIKKMSNEDQRIVDMQIEIFAYWKLMKKRLCDYVIMSTHSELNKLINTELKPALLEVAIAKGDDEVIKLLSADERTVRKRNKISGRLGRLLEAKSKLEEYYKTADQLS